MFRQLSLPLLASAYTEANLLHMVAVNDTGRPISCFNNLPLSPRQFMPFRDTCF